MVVTLSQPGISLQTIDACRRGDRDALRSIYEAYKDRVYSLALYFFHGDPSAAADVTQQVFLKLITAAAQFRGDSDFGTWLHRLTANTCLDSARSAKSRERTANLAALEPLATPATYEDDLAQAQTAASVQAALSSLPPKLRMPVLLRYFEDLSYQEVATTLNCSMGTVASRLNRAHELLSRKLASLRGAL